MAAIAAAALLAPPANAGMSSGTKVKVHRAQLRATMQKSQESGGPALETCKSGDLEIGTIQAERGARVPSDVTVVVDGDVINLNDGRSSHVCR
jgi:hypothetical protein